MMRRRTARARYAIWMALGMLVLANSRAFEGLVLTLLSFAAMAFGRFWRRLPRLKLPARSLKLPLAVVLVPGALAMGYYNWRVTGHSLRQPYVGL